MFADGLIGLSKYSTSVQLYLLGDISTPSSQCGAVSFIENVGAKNLKIDEEEFKQKMGYVDNKTDIDLFLEEGVVEDETDMERIMVLGVRTYVLVEITLEFSLTALCRRSGVSSCYGQSNVFVVPACFALGCPNRPKKDVN